MFVISVPLQRVLPCNFVSFPVSVTAFISRGCVTTRGQHLLSESPALDFTFLPVDGGNASPRRSERCCFFPALKRLRRATNSTAAPEQPGCVKTKQKSGEMGRTWLRKCKLSLKTFFWTDGGMDGREDGRTDGIKNE